MFWGDVLGLELGHYVYDTAVDETIEMSLASFSERENVMGLLWVCLCVGEVIPQSSVFSNDFQYSICSHHWYHHSDVFFFLQECGRSCTTTASCTVVERHAGNSCFVKVAAILTMKGKEFDNLCILSSVSLITTLLAALLIFISCTSSSASQCMDLSVMEAQNPPFCRCVKTSFGIRSTSVKWCGINFR